MRKFLLVAAFILISGSSFLMAQISQGGIPPSFKYAIKSDVDKVVLQPRDMKYVLNEEEKLAKNGTLPHIGYSLSTDISMANSGTWTDLPEGGRIWQVQIKAPSALAQVVYYDNFNLPVGTKLFLYNEDKTQILGAYTWYNNDPSGVFANELIYGDVVNLEYYEPARVMGKPSIHINQIGYIYRGVTINKNTNWTEPSDACEININCSPVGDNWQDEKKGVARILVTTPQGQGWCTGSLVNNTNQNCTPYFLTAWHCYEDATATQLNQWIFYFNYEASGCTTPSTEPTSNSMTGASLKAKASINGGSDFILLQLNQTVPTNYNPYMNGWNRANSVTGPGVGIHHPMSSIKKISTFNSATTSTYSGSATNAHWKIIWVSNSNGWGVTEGGSSGSPIFDANSRIVGTLTGGSSYCSTQSSPDYYGKVYYHWDQNAGGTTTQLKTWLDPTTSGVTVLDGKNCGTTTAPVANFVGTPTTVNPGQSVVFTNLSTGTITSYSWSFPGGTPSTATGVGPHTVTYNTLGVYNASLTVGTPSNTMTKTNYITVTNGSTYTCDTLMASSFTSGTCNLSIYYADATPYDSGYVSGQNAYLDKEKAMLYTGATAGTISDVFVMYGLKKGTTGNSSVKIYSSNAGAPGNLLGTSATIVKSAIDTTNQGINFNNKYHFSTPITTGTDFFVSAVLPTAFNNTTNQLAIWCSQYTCSSTSPLAYEMWSDNTWHSFATAWGTNIDMAIFPVVCSGTSGIYEVANGKISIFPNPANNEVFVVLPNLSGEKANVQIFDIYGKLCKQLDIYSSMEGPAKINLSDLQSGIYLLQIESAKGKFVEKISVIK